MAVYKPYSGGNPAIVANATPCGKTITAPVKPATMSALRVVELTNLNQSKKGNMDESFITKSTL